jgi:hypothetical protein
LHRDLQSGLAWLPGFRMGIEHPTQWSDLQRAGLMRRRWGLDAILNLLLECAGGTNVLTEEL